MFDFPSLLYSTEDLLYSTILYSTALHYTMLYCTILNYAPLCHLMLCSAMHSTLLCSALLSSGLLSSPLLYCTLIYSSILHHTILCICTLGEPWAECPRILQQLSYNLHRKNNTESCQRTPRIHPENLKIPSQTTPKNTLKCILNPPWEPPWNQP